MDLSDDELFREIKEMLRQRFPRTKKRPWMPQPASELERLNDQNKLRKILIKSKQCEK